MHSRVIQGARSSNLLILIFILGIYSLIISLIAIHRYISYQSSWDLGVFTQVFEGLCKFGFMYDTMDFYKNPSGNYLGTHFSPFIVMFAPIYYILPTPVTLLVIQVVFYSVGAIPLYLIARMQLSELSSILISLIYLIHPGTLYLLLYDFHEISFFPTLFISAAYFYFAEQYLIFLLLFIFSCMVNEFTPIVMCFFSLYLCFFNDQILMKNTQEKSKIGRINGRLKVNLFSFLALILSIIMIVISFYVEYLINPIWKPQQGWTTLGSSLEEILINMVTRPDLVLKSLVSDAQLKLVNIIYLLGPYLFLPFLSGFFLIVIIPWMAATLLSSSPICTIYLHYHTMHMPLIAIATIMGVRKLSKAINIESKKIIASTFLATIIFTSLIGPLGLISAPYGCCSREQLFGYRIDLTRKTIHDIYDLFIDLIPTDTIVLTQVRFYPHLSDKTPYVLLHIPPDNWDFYYLIPYKEKLAPDYILLDLSEGSFNIGISYKWKNGTIRYISTLSSVENILDDTWGVFAEFDSIVLYKRNFKGSPIIYNRFIKIYDPTKLIYRKDEVTFYEKENIIEYSGDGSLVFWYGPYDFYPPGIYNATFILRIKPGTYYDNLNNEIVLTLDVAADEGKIIMISREVKFNELTDEWKTFTIQFKVPLKPLKLEFRGLHPYPKLPIQLQKIVIERIM